MDSLTYIYMYAETFVIAASARLKLLLTYFEGSAVFAITAISADIMSGSG